MKKLFPGYPLGTTEQKPATPKKNGTNNSKIQKLGLTFTPLEKSFTDMVEGLVAIGALPKL